ncbi:MAG: hypothetical protein AAFY65_00125 [Pseudomonadota bacterium]
MSFNIMIVGQRGRLAYEAALFAASLRHTSPGWTGQLIIAEPEPSERWDIDPRIPEGPVRTLLVQDLGCEIKAFRNWHFGQSYPNGNKIEGLTALPDDPFIFFDTDTVITGPLDEIEIDFSRPSASMKRENTWPQIEIYGPGYKDIWQSLHVRFGNDFESTLDLSWPDEFWRRYLYFNAGWFFGSDPGIFHDTFRDAALMIRDDPPSEVVCQTLNPWLDQAALPLVITKLNGGQPGEKGGIAEGLFDGSHSFHYRYVPMMYATAPDHVIETVEAAAAPNRIKKVLKEYEPFKRFIYQPKGAKARALFDRTDLPRKEQAIRNRLKRENLWAR